MPFTDIETLHKAQAIFEQVIELPESTWDSLLTQKCNGNKPLYKTVRSLLDAHLTANSQPTELFSQSVIGALNEAHDSSLVGSKFGPYSIIKKIGSGGMGDVYLAERSDHEYNKQVAIKMVRAQFIDDSFNSWLRNERQILATLEHPNICRLLDGSTDSSGKPYLVMEYVHGSPIDIFCKNEKKPLKATLELFLTLCNAVSHAHQNLIVHRDIKPGNILISADGHLKLMDFGIAQPLNKELNQSKETHYARTTKYASPEQNKGKQVGIQGDIYSLGIVLNELLEQFHLEKVQKKPISTLAKKELQHIITVATQINPQDRYSSVAHFADEIKNHLLGFSISSYSSNWIYRLYKFTYRHRWVSAIFIALIASILGFIITTILYNRQLMDERNTALDEQQRAATSAAFLVDIFRFADDPKNQQDNASIRRVLKNGKQQLDVQIADESLLKIDLLQTLASVYHNLGMFEESKSLLDEAETLITQYYRLDKLKLARNDTQLARVLIASNQIHDATQKSERALSINKQALGRHSKAALTNLHQMAEIHKYNGNYKLAEELLEEIIDNRITYHADNKLEKAATYVQLAEVYLNNDRFSKAESLLSKFILELNSSDTRTLTKRSDVIQFLAIAKRSLGKYKEALSLFEENLLLRKRLYPEGHPSISITLNNLGMTYAFMGSLDESERYLRDALAMDIDLLGLDHAQTLHAMNNLAFTLMDEGRYQEAEELFKSVRDSAENLYGENHYTLGIYLTNIIIILNKQQQYEQACQLVNDAQRLLLTSLAEDNWRFSVLNSAQGICIQNNESEAINILTKSYERLNQLLGSESAYTKEALERLNSRFPSYISNQPAR